MARMPDARWLGEHSPGRAMARYDIVCIHTIVGYAPAHAAHFSVHHDGTIDQSRDTKYQSGANLNGNPRIIAIENEDHGTAYGTWDTRNGHAVPGFTPEQVEANAQILAWAHITHGVPLQLCPDSRPGSRGLAYHRQGIDGNFSTYAYPGRVEGGELWTESYGKVCPGDQRISAREHILARAYEIVTAEDGMPLTEEDAKLVAAKVWSALTDDPRDDATAGKVTMETLLNRMRKNTADTQTKVDANLPVTIGDVVINLDDQSLAQIAAAVADEQARRLQA